MSVSISTDSPAFFQARKGPAVPTHPMAAPSSSHCGWWERKRGEKRVRAAADPGLTFFPLLFFPVKKEGEKKGEGQKKGKENTKVISRRARERRGAMSQSILFLFFLCTYTTTHRIFFSPDRINDVFSFSWALLDCGRRQVFEVFERNKSSLSLSRDLES